jgi:release factor glutamine methyltransferase
MSKPSTDWTVLKMLEWATSYFEEKEIPNPRFSIEWILAHALEVKRLDLYLIFDRPLKQEELDLIRPLVKRRATHEPLQYITGETDFFGCNIKVKPGVLIPRPETEELIEGVLENHSGSESHTVLDIGTGSGCIPIALKKNRPGWIIRAIDVFKEAIDIARQNSDFNNVEINFSIDDIYSPSQSLLLEDYDIIISNPPYVLESESTTLDREVKDFEPSLALFTSSTNKIYSAIEKFASNSLRKNGLLALEINERFGEETLQIFDQDCWDASILKDYAGKDRFLFAKKSK